MKKQLLLKYIKGKATKEEEAMIIEWVKLSPDNKKYLAGLNNLWLLQSMPDSTASESEMEKIRIFTSGRKVIRFKKLLPYAAIVILLISLGANLLLVSKLTGLKTSNGRVLLSEIPVNNKVTVFTNKGVKGFVILPDSSKVWLNSGSKISYPAKFTGKTREVLISGEAYFEVEKDKERPMIVSTEKNFIIEVLGTRFNVKAYEDDSFSEATLYSGEIKIKTESGNNKNSREILMKPLETVLISENNITSLTRQKDTTVNAEWKKGILLFDNTPMNEVIRRIERWHGVTFAIKDSSILNHRITASFNSESAIQIMEMIRYTSPVDYRMEGSVINVFRR
jgi:ferric-dicitrate binding protein FerR (iron transport regulator)